MLFTVRVLQPFPALDLHAGDLVLVEPGGTQPITLLRPLPCNYGAVVGLLEDGMGELLTPQTSVSQLAQAVGYPLAPCAGAVLPPSRRSPHLVRLK